jgi:hypothetical protein
MTMGVGGYGDEGMLQRISIAALSPPASASIAFVHPHGRLVKALNFILP